LPDQAWFEQRTRFVQRVRRSLLSGNEIRLLREFKLLKQNEISMFGYYGSFEALMVRGYIVELDRKPPSSRPLVTYRLTAQGEQVISALKDEPAI
jgi:predicted transcriptional regulator